MIRVETAGPVATLRIERGKGNALNIALLEALDSTLADLEMQKSVGAIILTGQGRVFGAGVDLPELLAGGEPYVRKFMPLLTRVFGRLARLPKPVVAAVNGHAIAGGAILMLACDQRLLALGDARLGLSEVLVGVRFPAWAMEIARFATPPEHFPTLICTGRSYAPDEALRRGLVDEVVPHERLEDRALEVALELAAILPSAFAAAKRDVRRHMFAAVRAAEPADAEVTEHWVSAEVQARIADFCARTLRKK